MSTPATTRIPRQQLHEVFSEVLKRHGVSDDIAEICANTFTANSVDGVYSHGVNRFPKFISVIQKGLIKIDAKPTLSQKLNALERWNGQSGIGITNAFHAMDRAIVLASQGGIGCVALSHTNHWMRAGTYVRHAAERGFASMCWSNTVQNTAAWGALDPRLGNNPLAMGVPYQGDAIVLDMAMSQYSYGALDSYRMKGETLPVPGGFNQEGGLTQDPKEILESRRTLPIGYWKGTGLSLLLDIMATVLSGGLSVSEISKQPEETNMSQVFIAFDLKALSHSSAIPDLLNTIVKDFHGARPENDEQPLRYPGERLLKIREENERDGVPVLDLIWKQIIQL